MKYVPAFYAFFFSLLYPASARAIPRITFLKIVLQNNKEFVAHISQR